MLNLLLKANRFLTSHRYTHDTLSDSQEAFTSVLDLSTADIYSEGNLIPSASLPFSSSVDSGHTSSVVKYWYRQALTPSNVSRDVWFFEIPSGSTDGAQLINGGQQTNFISPKYSISSLSQNSTEDNTPGYLAKCFLSLTQSAPNDNDVIQSTLYSFDYKTGVLQFSSSTPAANKWVFLTVYQYIGNTLNNKFVVNQLTASNISVTSLVGSLVGTASWASQSISASWAPTSSPGTTLFTGSTYQITSSWSSNAVTASFASTVVTASFAINAGNSATASSVTTASYANTFTRELTTGSNYQVTSSWSLNSITTSYVNANNIDGTVLSSSYAQTASWAVNAINGGTQLITGSTYPITSSASVTSSYAFTSSVVNNFPFDNVTATINITGSNVILFQKITGSFNTAFFDYSVSSGSSQRAGIMFGTWNNNSIFYTEQTTIDIGDTNTVSMSMVLSTSFVQFLGFSQNTNNWTVKSFIRYL